MPSSFSALRNINYRIYFGAQMASMTGSWMQSTVQAWMVYQLTHSAAWLGIISFCVQVPAFLASPLAGVWADRMDRRRILVGTAVLGMAQAFVLAALTWSGALQIWQIAVLAVVLGITNAFDLTTRHAFAFNMVGKEELPSAIACNSIIVNASRIVGPGLAGILLSLIGEGWCFFINGLSYLAVILGLKRIRLPPTPPAPQEELRSPFSEMREALRYVLRTPEIWRLLAASIFMSFFGFPYMVLLPVFAKSQLHGDAGTLAWLTAMSGLGAILGALTRTSQNSLTFHLEAKLPSFFLGLAASLALLAAAKVLSLSLVAVFLCGFFLMGTYPAINTAIQQRVADSMRGKVLSLYSMTFLGTTPLGGLLSGWAADRIGAPRVVYLAAVVFALTSLGLICISGLKWLEFRSKRLS